MNYLSWVEFDVAALITLPSYVFNTIKLYIDSHDGSSYLCQYKGVRRVNRANFNQFNVRSIDEVAYTFNDTTVGFPVAGAKIGFTIPTHILKTCVKAHGISFCDNFSFISDSDTAEFAEWVDANLNTPKVPDAQQVQHLRISDISQNVLMGRKYSTHVRPIPEPTPKISPEDAVLELLYIVLDNYSARDAFFSRIKLETIKERIQRDIHYYGVRSCRSLIGGAFTWGNDYDWMSISKTFGEGVLVLAADYNVN